jgi:hypothetical protein
MPAGYRLTGERATSEHYVDPAYFYLRSRRSSKLHRIEEERPVVGVPAHQRSPWPESALLRYLNDEVGCL